MNHQLLQLALLNVLRLTQLSSIDMMSSYSNTLRSALLALLAATALSASMFDMGDGVVRFSSVQRRALREVAAPATGDDFSYQAWCRKTTYEALCVSTVQCDPREDLKSSPQGLVVILVDAAKAKANVTISFIEGVLTSENNGIDKDIKGVLEGCMSAYNLEWVESALSVDVQQVMDAQQCSGVNGALTDASGEVTYDCEWDLPAQRPPSLRRMFDEVEAFASLVECARQILGLIGCAGS